MMKREVDDATPVPANRATPSGFLDEHPLQLLLPTGDRFANIALASPAVVASSSAVQGELRQSMSLTALDRDGTSSIRIWRTALVLE
jgi:hypothetical protein